MNKVGRISKIKDRKIANDVMFTPICLALKLIEIAEIQPTDRVLDPCKGEGVFFDNLPDCVKDWCEVTENKDFFEFNEPVDVIIGNPPFSQWKKWLEHTVALNPRKICYIMGVLNLTALRIDFMKKNGYNLTRIHMTNVDKWFSNTLLVIFEKGGISCITHDTERRKA